MEYEGKTYKTHRDLKDALLRQSDYTRKTQEVAETRRELEARQEALQYQSEIHQDLLDAHASKRSLEKTISQYEKVDWATYQQSDPMSAQQHWMAYQNAINQRSKVNEDISNKEQERSLAQQQDFAKRVEEGNRTLQRDIKGWNADMALKVREFAKTQGLTDQQMNQITDPAIVKILHAAWLGSKAKTPAKSTPKEDVKPLAKTSKGTGKARSGLSDSLPLDEWVARFDKQRQSRN